MNRIQSFFNSQHGLGNNLNYDFALRRLGVAKEDSWRGIVPSHYSSDYNPEPPIFSAKFAQCDGYRHILAIANEDGKIALQDTTQRNYEPEEKSLNAPQCHCNAVFDLEWAPGEMMFVSASGDHTAKLWEVNNSEIRAIRHFNGHSRSVKTVAYRKNDPSVFATGGRDGAIIIWDTRASLNVDFMPRADNCILSGHVGGPSTPVSQRNRTRTPKFLPHTVSSSITGLVFQDPNTIISCGAGDGIIKVWDMRRNYITYRKEPSPRHCLPYAGTSTFKGFTNLLVDASGSRLYANCMDNTIYCYNLNSFAPNPLARYKGFMNGTFYIKACLSPDGKYLLSGSSDEKAYIWNLNYPDEPLVALWGHTVEVTCVAWGSTHDRPIVTCSDDARHKIWRIGPERITDSNRLEYYRGHAEFVRVFERKTNGSTHKYNLRDLESTPRTLKRLMEQNERTPSSVEKPTTKRSFLEMLGTCTSNDSAEEQEQKRPKLSESRGRRLFSPSTSSAACCAGASSSSSRCMNLQLTAIPEDCCNQENSAGNLLPSFLAKTSSPTHNYSPLTDRTLTENHNHIYVSPPPATSTAITSASNITAPTHQLPPSTGIFSPTSNLPNFVLDGEAPHLGVISPKRKLKDKVDWLTKIRKQKLLSCRTSTLTEKMNDGRPNDICTSQAGTISSPRLQSLRNSEGSPRLVTPRRRTSHSGHLHEPMSPTTSHHPKTPTSSKRNSETTILRFFSVQPSVRRSPVSPAPNGAPGHATVCTD